MSDKICSTLNCGKKIAARGFCTACYYRYLRRGDLISGTPTKGWKHRLSNIDIINKTADCSECGFVKIQSRNKKQSQWRCSNPANHKSKLYKRAYRQERKNQLSDRCEICGTNNGLCWDHNHKTGKFRGTLCNKCNMGLGLFNDNSSLLQKASEYLNDRSRTSEKE